MKMRENKSRQNNPNWRFQLEIAQSGQDVSPFCKESDMTYSWKRQFGLSLRQ